MHFQYARGMHNTQCVPVLTHPLAKVEGGFCKPTELGRLPKRRPWDRGLRGHEKVQPHPTLKFPPSNFPERGTWRRDRVTAPVRSPQHNVFNMTFGYELLRQQACVAWHDWYRVSYASTVVVFRQGNGGEGYSARHSPSRKCRIQSAWRDLQHRAGKVDTW